MRVTIPNVAVTGITAAVPAGEFDLLGLSAEFGQAETERLIASTGIKKLRIAPAGVTTADLSVKAAEHLIAELNINRADIDGVVFASQTPDYIMPSTAVSLQHRLGLSTATVAFDINYGCSAYIYGLFQAAMLVNTGACKNVLVCAGDVITRYVNPADRSIRVVFGDASSATLITAGSQSISFHFFSDGGGGKFLVIPAGGCRLPRTAETAIATEQENGNLRSQNDLYMDGMEVMNFALREVPKSVEQVLAQHGWQPAEVGMYGLHQANSFMINYIRRKMKLPAEAVPVAMAETGNTGPASIPLMLSITGGALRQENRLEKAVLCGFGVGLSVGSAALNLSETVILPFVEL